LFETKRNEELLGYFERERAAVLKKHRMQISALQTRMIELQRYCLSLENSQNNVQSNNNTKAESVKGVYSEQLGYYREKNKELE
jgi:hypothetical protein